MTLHKYQLALPRQEMEALANLVLTGFRNAIPDHNKRIARWADYTRRWRGLVDTPEAGDEEKSNFRVPLVAWLTLAQLAKETDSIFGEDAEIVAVPQGPSDHRNVHKIGKYMTWRVLRSMKILRSLMVFVLRKILLGKAHAYVPWETRTYMSKGKEVEEYSGPGFFPIPPDDLIVPAEDVVTIHDFSWVIRRYTTTPDAMLDGEEQGLYQTIEDNYEEILNAARNPIRRDAQSQQIRKELDIAEGVNYENPMAGSESLTILEWYGRRRMPNKKSDGGADEYDLARREMRQTELVVRVLLETEKVVGVQKLEVLYPDMAQRRPIREASFLTDLTYWPRGMAELVADCEDELSANHNLATEAAELAVAPPTGYRPASGMKQERFKRAPGDMIPLDNPQTDIRELTTTFNAPAATWKEQVILSYVERMTGLNDGSMGRQSDRPNAPRTARQALSLLEESNVRISLATKLLAEDLNALLLHFWTLDCQFAPEQLFFRVTEEDANGLFEVKQGGSIITTKERDGRYDFQIKFANSVYSREAEKERVLARYQLDMQNPLIATNPAALWKVTNDVHRALGDPNFAHLVPKPPEGDMPVEPREEWARLQQGETVTVNPMDNDELHLIRHRQDLVSAQADPNGNPDAVKSMTAHFAQHVQQLQQKKVIQAITEHAAAAVQKMGLSGALPPELLPGAPMEEPQGGMQ
jgi:hypothetical protein